MLKPPRNSSITTGDAYIGCPAPGGAQRKPSIQSSQEASDAAVFQHHHAFGEASPDNIPGDGPVPLAPFGTSAISSRSAAAGAQQMHKREGGGVELEPEAVVVGDLATPLASAGAGDVGAEHDATPLQSRHKSSSRSGGFASPRSSSGGGGGARGETASEGAASVSGFDDSVSSVGEGPGGLKRKDTITWESFLANITVSDEAKEGGGAKGAEAAAGSCSDSSPPVAMRLPPEAASEGAKVGLVGLPFFFSGF